MSNDADKRTVTTDALTTLGMIIDDSQKRDAIHLAVEPVIAGCNLMPGWHVDIRSGVAHVADIGKGMGIVDPFLPLMVKEGQRFWFIMYPRQVRSLRHVWSHPDFPDEITREANPNPVVNATRRVEEIAKALGDGLDYDRLMQGAAERLDDGWQSITQQGSQGWQDSFPAYATEFWALYHVITGDARALSRDDSFFSCSC